jgi:hypothetical protein
MIASLLLTGAAVGWKFRGGDSGGFGGRFGALWKPTASRTSDAGAGIEDADAEDSETPDEAADSQPRD